MAENVGNSVLMGFGQYNTKVRKIMEDAEQMYVKSGFYSINMIE
jgi:hypothetical protein